MLSRIAWLQVSLYASVVIFLIGVSLIGLSFTRIPRKIRNVVRDNKYHKQNLDMQEIRSIAQDVKQMTDSHRYKFGYHKNKYLLYSNHPMQRKDDIIRTIGQLNNSIKVYRSPGNLPHISPEIDIIRYDQTKLNDIKYVSNLIHQAKNKADFMYNDLFPFEGRALQE